MKVALVTTTPSVASEIGEATHALVPYLRRHCEVEVFVANEHAGIAADGTVLNAAKDLAPKRFDHILYQLGNEAHHAFMAPMVREFGGTVVQHDWSLCEMTRAAHPGLTTGGVQGFALAWREGGIREARIVLASRRERRGEVAARAAAPITEPVHSAEVWPELAQLALNRSVVRGGDAFIVHSRALKERILIDRNAPTPIAIVQHGAERGWRHEDRALARERLGWPQEWSRGFVVASASSARGNPRLERMLGALARVRARHADVFATIVGVSEDEHARLGAQARAFGVEEAVAITGSLSPRESLEHFHAADIGLHLSGPDDSDPARGAFRAFSMGRPVIGVEPARASGIPEACLVTVSDADDVQGLTRSISDLRERPEQRRVMEQAVRTFVDQQCHWSIIARQYADFLETCPAPRSKKKSLIKVMIEASERRRSEDAAADG